MLSPLAGPSRPRRPRLIQQAPLPENAPPDENQDSGNTLREDSKTQGLHRAASSRSPSQPRQEVSILHARQVTQPPPPSTSETTDPANPTGDASSSQSVNTNPGALPSPAVNLTDTASLSSGAAMSSLESTTSSAVPTGILPTNAGADSSASSSASSSSSPSSSYSRPWTYTASPSKTTSGSAPSETTFVPGVVFDLSLGGTSETQAIYSVPMTFGHDDGFSRKRGQTYQVLNMQVDLGSSDMWAAVKSCKSSDCKASSTLFNNVQSLIPDVPVDLSMNYEAGAVSGGVNWEQVTIGNFGIAYQAFLAATDVQSEDLSGGNFQGLLGLALPANSIIEDAIPGTTGSNPDGATFLDNLFGAGSSAPSQRLFSLALERREDSRTLSSFGIGAVDERLCPLPCSPNFIPIIPHANMGKTGYLHWRVPLQGMKAYTFATPATGDGATSQNISLGTSLSDSAQKYPLAILDSGGVQILVGSRSYADAIYGAYGIQASSDGLYRMPCTTQLAYSFIIGQEEFVVHPLDMSYPDPADPSRQMCIGAVQVSNTLGNKGDFVLGSTFLKNVYSVYKYPDQKSSKSWQPMVGMKSLTTASGASCDFYAVRNQHLSLTTVSGENGNNSPISGGASSNSQHRVVNTAIIAACSVVGVFVVTAGAFCAWWFFLRRKVGDKGVVEYNMPEEPKDPEIGAPMNTSRSRKHETAKRQRSMVDGFSDADVEAWSKNNVNHRESIFLSRLEEAREGDNRIDGNGYAADALSNHTRGSSLHRGLLSADSPTTPRTPQTPQSDFYPQDRRGSTDTARLLAMHRERSMSADMRHERHLSVDSRHIRRLSADNRRLSVHSLNRPDFPRSASSNALLSPGSTVRLIDLQDTPPAVSPASTSYPSLPSVNSRGSHSPSFSMTGPFPGRVSHSDLDGYFPVLPVPTPEPVVIPDRTRRSSRSSLSVAPTMPDLAGAFERTRRASSRGSLVPSTPSSRQPS